ncbi:DUF397 domain-containing protein [Streptomyces sp. NPDC003077]|uniref:DUF397 domain-containing protein n=1 Tax=Streptomyces sp. NPDC003077 TaxID=3154443 RepID=UPI0033A82756
MSPSDAWFKSSYSNDSGGLCVEAAFLRSAQTEPVSKVGIRDSKNKSGPAVLVAATTWAAFVDFVTR